MRPRIQVLSGVRAGEPFPIKGARFTIGRDQTADICLADSNISRLHCVITFTDHLHYIEDAGSLNGTIVEAEMIAGKRPLCHGDRICTGGIVFIYLTEEDDVIPPDPRLHLVDTIPIQNPRMIAMERRSASLSIVVEAANAFRGKPEEFRTRLLDFIFDSTPADRVTIVLDRRGELEPICWRERRSPANPVQASRTVVRQVIQKGAAIISNDLAASGMNTISSLKHAKVESIICVPLEIFGQRFGVIYADCFNPEAMFDPTHFDVLTIIATIAASAFKHAAEIEGLEKRSLLLQKEQERQVNLIGGSQPILELKEMIRIAAPSDSTVLIQGETGTGKEAIARGVHKLSARKSAPFVTIDCTNIPKDLLQSELFGHERGSFTGASERKLGLFELADSGTVFLDEIGELPLAQQSAILRVLQEGTIARVGGLKPIAVDVRIIAATNRDLEAAVAKGEFREDLYWRLNVIPIHAPALRDRPDDIPQLANHFLEKYRHKASRPILGISSEVMTMLSAYHWPGNVRALEHMIERAIVLCQTDIIMPKDLRALESFKTARTPDVREKTYKELQYDLTREAILRTDGDYKHSARILGIRASSFHRRVGHMGLTEFLKQVRRESKRQ